MIKYIQVIALLCLFSFVSKAQDPQETWTLNQEVSGTKNYVARDYIFLKKGFAYIPGTGESLKLQIDRCLLFPPSNAKYKTPEGEITTDPNLGGVVGFVPGQFNVTPSGAATYTISIECPAGINGLKPDISIGYNSLGGNGIAGWGVEINGLSSIGRTGSNLYHEGLIKAVAYSNNDHLTLDGQRLILTSGSHFTIGAEYRTEIESYNKITYSQINGLACFVVRAKDGRTFYYGLSDDSNIQTQNGLATSQWLLKKTEDANGNYITYNYFEDNSNGESRLQSIGYAGNTNTGTPEINTLVFEYATRTDQRIIYSSGNKLSATNILKKITSKANNQIYREYEFTYEYDGFYNKLTQVEYSGSDGTKVNPTNINWDNLDSPEPPLMSMQSFDTDLTYINGSLDQSTMFVDFNNDGLIDFMQPMLDPMNYVYIGWELYLSSNNGANFTLSQSENLETDLDLFPFHGSYSLLPCDVNIDGYTDILEVRSVKDQYNSVVGYKLDILLSINGNLTRQYLDWTVDGSKDSKFNIADYNGNGRQELVVIDNNFKLYSLDITKDTPIVMSITNASVFTDYKTTDINGNHLPEIYCTYTGNIYEYNNSTQKFEDVSFNEKIDAWAGQPEFGDFNQDGNTDVLIYDSINETWKIKLSTGKGFVEIACPLTRPRESDSDLYYIADYNNDGTSDILEIYKSGYDNIVNVYYYNGVSFTKDTHTIRGYQPIFYKNNTIPFYDLNADGTNDLITLDYSDSKCYSFNTNESAHRISSIENGLGHTSTIKYKPLTDNLVYSKGEAIGDESVIKIRPAMYVVESTKFQAADVFINIEYFYTGLKLHTKGKGILGFDEFSQTNTNQNRYSIMRFGYDPKYYNVYPLENKVFTADNKPISTTSFINDNIELIGKRIFPYIKTQTTTGHLTGLITSVENLAFDDWGNILTSRITKGNLVKNKQIEYIQKGSWCNNKPSSILTTNTQGGKSYARKTLYEFDNKGNVTKETKDPEDKNKLIKTIDYDGFGNPVLLVTTGSGTSESKTIEYDTAGLFIKKTTDNKTGFYTTYQFNQTIGLLQSQTNHLGLVTKYGYDGFGNRIKTEYPDGRYSQNSTQWASNNSPSNTLYYTYNETSGESPAQSWYDALGQEIRVDTYGLDDQTKVCVKTAYNINGDAITVSKPYFENGSIETELAFEYDDYGRVTTQTTPLGDIVISYDGLIKTVTAPDKITIEELNSAAQLISSQVNGKAVSYEYWPSGLIKTSTPTGGVGVYTEYDQQGNRILMIDPDIGTVESEYNAFGEILWDEFENNNDGVLEKKRTSYTYDAAHRIISTNCNGNVTENSFDPNTGFLNWTKTHDHEVYYTYDEGGKPYLGRITTAKEKIGTDKEFIFKSAYNAFGKESKRTFPSGFSILKYYTKFGYLAEIKQANGQSIWKADESNERGQLTKTIKGNNITYYDYDSRGLPTGIIANGAINHNYVFNNKGNLYSREDFISQHKEVFSYDLRNQLTGWTLSKLGAEVENFSINYDQHGNITSKSDLEFALNYNHSSKIHALTSISGNPSAMADATQDITYNDFNKVKTINEANKELILEYGVGGQRTKGVYKTDMQTTLTRYYVGQYEEDHTLGNVKKTHYISADDGLAAIYVENNGVGKLYYAYTDLLGSLVALTDANGNIETLNGTKQQFAFDAWGNRRNPLDWTQKIGGSPNFVTDRGYTMHEHLDDFALINMNGRCYDPLLARFLSPDPYIQSPGDALNYNRFAYCMNNPFLFTDPSGYNWFSSLWSWMKENKQTVVVVVTIVVAVVVTVATAGVGSPLLVAAIGGAAGGFAGGVLGGALDEKGIWQCLGDGLVQGAIGFASGYVGGAVGQWAAKGGLGFVTGTMGYTIQSPVVNGALGGFFGGAASGGAIGFSVSFVGTLISTGDIGQAIDAGISAGIKGAVQGGALGVAAGTFAGFKYAKKEGLDPWNGRKLNTTSKDLTDAFGIGETIDRINRGEQYNHRNDGTTFRNNEGFLPKLEHGSYTEYVHPTPGVNGPGLQRIVIGPSGETYYTPDHYSTFFKIK